MLRGWLAGAFAAVLLPGCVGLDRTALDEQPWIEVETPNLSIWTCVHERTARRLARNLEIFRRVSEFVIGRELPEARLPLRMIHFPDLASYAAFGPPGSAGVYLPSMRENLLLSSGTSMHVIQHEYVHFLLGNHSSFIYPPWYHEGFAEFLGATRIRAGDVEIGGVPPGGPPRVTFQGHDTWSPVGELLAFGVGGHRGDRGVRQRYSESWALVHYLYFGRGPEARGAAQVGRYLRLVEEGTDLDAAVESAFGMPVERLDQELRDYAEASRYKFLTQDGERFGAVEEPTVNPLDPSDVALTLGALARQQGNEREARNYFDEVLARRPQDPGALLEKALLQPPENPDPAVEGVFFEALAANPEDAAIHRRFGELLHSWAANEKQDAAARSQLVRRARDHYSRSSKLDDRVPETYARYGATFLLQGEDAREGIEPLEHARRLLPASVWILSSLARLYWKVGDEQEARRLALAAYASPGYGTRMSESEIAALEEILESTGGVPREGVGYD